VESLETVQHKLYLSDIYCCCLQLDSSLQGMLNENSFDLTSKFADLIAASAISNDASALSASTAVELRAQSAQTNVYIDVAQQ